MLCRAMMLDCYAYRVQQTALETATHVVNARPWSTSPVIICNVVNRRHSLRNHNTVRKLLKQGCVQLLCWQLPSLRGPRAPCHLSGYFNSKCSKKPLSRGLDLAPLCSVART